MCVCCVIKEYFDLKLGFALKLSVMTVWLEIFIIVDIECTCKVVLQML